jgi:hypothetical protein
MNSYIKEVKSRLNLLPKNLGKIQGYNNGFGISICPDLGDGYVSTVEVIQTRFTHVQCPTTTDSKEWDKQWDNAKKIVNNFIKKYNKTK